MNANSQSVLVTGSAKGIGQAITQRLIELGMHVYAGVRSNDDAVHWRSSAGASVHPVILDVTDDASIQAAAQEIRTSLGSRQLTGVVNNAGIGVAGPLEFLPIAELRRAFEV